MSPRARKINHCVRYPIDRFSGVWRPVVIYTVLWSRFQSASNPNGTTSMEYTWTLVSNTDDQGLGSETSLLNCNLQGSHPGQILILSNESNAQPIQNQNLADITTSPLDKDYAVNRMHSNEPRKLHLMHSEYETINYYSTRSRPATSKARENCVRQTFIESKQKTSFQF